MKLRYLLIGATGRVFADCLLFASVFFLPWWIVFIFASVSFFMFNDYYELLGAGFILDFMYGIPLSRYGEFQFIFSLSSLALFFLFSSLKKRMRFSKRVS